MHKIANFKRKNLAFLPGYAFKLDGENLILGGPGHLVVNINITQLNS